MKMTMPERLAYQKGCEDATRRHNAALATAEQQLAEARRAMVTAMEYAIAHAKDEALTADTLRSTFRDLAAFLAAHGATQGEGRK